MFAGGIVLNASAAMVEVQMREQHIGNVVSMKPFQGKGLVNGEGVLQVIVRKELFALLAANAGVYKRKTISVFHQQTTHGPGAKVHLVGRIGLLPQLFRHNTKHGAAV